MSNTNNYPEAINHYISLSNVMNAIFTNLVFDHVIIISELFAFSTYQGTSLKKCSSSVSQDGDVRVKMTAFSTFPSYGRGTIKTTTKTTYPTS
jgi:hypothetical protein